MSEYHRRFGITKGGAKVGDKNIGRLLTEADIGGMAAEMAEHCAKQSPLDHQEGGDHYRNLAIQPVEFIQANGLTFLEGCVIKRVCRHRNKAGAEDIRKAIHELQLILQMEYPDDV